MARSARGGRRERECDSVVVSPLWNAGDGGGRASPRARCRGPGCRSVLDGGETG